jgi:uncharacterized protein
MEILIVLGLVFLMVAIIRLVLYFTEDNPYKRNKKYGGGGDIYFHSYNSTDTNNNNDFDGFGGGSGGGGGYSGSYGDDGDSGGDSGDGGGGGD